MWGPSLAERGLRLDEDVGASDYRSLYFGPSASRMRGYEFYRIAVARVPEIPLTLAKPPNKPSEAAPDRRRGSTM